MSDDSSTIPLAQVRSCLSTLESELLQFTSAPPLAGNVSHTHTVIEDRIMRQQAERKIRFLIDRVRHTLGL